jgi:hypothetical protein
MSVMGPLRVCRCDLSPRVGNQGAVLWVGVALVALPLARLALQAIRRMGAARDALWRGDGAAEHLRQR